MDVLAAGNPPDARGVSVAERRTKLADLMKFAAPAPAIGETRDLTLPMPGGPVQGAPVQGAPLQGAPLQGAPLPARLYSPAAAPGAAAPGAGAAGATALSDPAPVLPGLIYFHGGGLVAGSIDTHDSIARALAHHGACRVISVGYRLAPEHPFPAALDDASAAIAYIGARAADFGIDARKLGVCGDSAGGTLAAATCQMAAQRGIAPIALQLLICPILDYTRTTGSRRDFATGYLVDQATLDHDLAHYAPGGADPRDPRISPLLAPDLSGAPRTVIHTAEFDPLRDEGEDYFKRLTHTGSAVSYTCHAGMIHLFYALGGVVPYARTAFERIGEDIRTVLGAAK